MLGPSRFAPPRQLRTGVSLAELTTIGIGGNARYFLEAHDSNQIQSAHLWASAHDLPVLFLGGGSNILFSDDGFPGLVISNSTTGLSRDGLEVKVAGGENLQAVIEWLNRNNLAGLEKMYGIPGTVAGALVGNAGAFGQEIKDVLTSVEVWSPSGTRHFSVEQLRYAYRHSLFYARPDLFVLSCTMSLLQGDGNLANVSESILKRRLEKYPTGLRCPGSFFKNVIVDDLLAPALELIPVDCVQYGKIPAGRLLEEVGAKGSAQGDAQFSAHHANLVVNRGWATSSDILRLTRKFAQRVWERYQVRLEPEVRIVASDGSLGFFWEH